MSIIRCCTVVAVLVAAGAWPAAGDERENGALVAKLTASMKQEGLESIAAHLGPGERRFVAALHLPDQMLMAIAADYVEPALLREKILLGRYRDVYLDLNGATDPASRVVIQDLRADGLRMAPLPQQAADVYTPRLKPIFVFDGDWKRQRMSEESYRSAFAAAEAEYTSMIRALISAVDDDTQ